MKKHSSAAVRRPAARGAQKDNRKSAAGGPLSPELLRKMDAYWRASNYLSVGQIYLLDNPLLEQPLERKHVKPRLVGHWGTTPGLNFLYVHLNRVIKNDDLNMIYVIGPGHGGPALVAHAYLEGTYSEVYPYVSRDEEGMKRLFKQFSFPGGIPSHVAPETPGSIHEGGELGYALSHAFGAAFDNPDLIVACVIGDGEAETGPLATGWHLISDNYFCRSATIRIAGRSRPHGGVGYRELEGSLNGIGRAGADDEAEANGRKNAGWGRGIGRHERADGEDLGGRSTAVGENGTQVADTGRPVLRGMGSEAGSVAGGGSRGGAGGEDASGSPH